MKRVAGNKVNVSRKIVFHKDKQISVNGLVVGKYKQPDPSGAAWARTPVFVFMSIDGKAAQARKRAWLEDDIISAYQRLQQSEGGKQ